MDSLDNLETKFEPRPKPHARPLPMVIEEHPERKMVMVDHPERKMVIGGEVPREKRHPRPVKFPCPKQPRDQCPNRKRVKYG